jgi:hypothetical protein
MTMTTIPVCPECGERAVRADAPRDRRYPDTFSLHAWVHTDGEPLCPVIGPDGYTAAQPDLPPGVGLIGAGLVGTWLEGPALRTDEELSVEIIRLAAVFGWEYPDSVANDLDQYAATDGAGEGLAYWLASDADDAITYLNSIREDGCVFEINSDGLVLYPEEID